MQFFGAAKDQIIRKHGEIPFIQSGRVEFPEEGVVPGLVVLAFDLQVGYRNGLGKFDRLGHPFAVRSESGAAVLEHKRVSFFTGAALIDAALHREEALRSQHREQRFDSPAPAFRQRSLR